MLAAAGSTGRMGAPHEMGMAHGMALRAGA